MAKQIYLLLVVVVLSGCATTIPTASEVRVPTPRTDTDGKYVSPYTSDDTVAPWVTKGRAARAGATAGKIVGRRAGEAALQSVPVLGGFLGKRVGRKLGREAAIALAGGREYMRETSDLSFDQADDLIVYLYARHSGHSDFEEVIQLTTEIYPEVGKRWTKAIKRAAVK